MIPRICLMLLPLALVAADHPISKPAETIFQVEGLECPSCVYIVQQAITEVAGVENVMVEQGFLGGLARVSYNPAKVSEHQIAHAVREAIPLHGTPYQAMLQINVTGYAKDGNAKRIKGLFQQWRQWVDLVELDIAKGQLLVRFLPMEPDDRGNVPRGWSISKLITELKAMRLAYEVVEPRPG